MVHVSDMRRRAPEPPAGLPDIQFKPGMADELLRELAPLLAEEGIDVSNIDVPDLDTLQQALSRAVERHNMAMFTPVGRARRLPGHHAARRRSHRRRQHHARSRSPGPGPARITRRPGRDRRWLHRLARPAGPVAVRARHQRPARAGRADPAARRTLDRGTLRPRNPHLARKRLAFASLDALITRQGGQHVLYGSALVLAAALQAWARHAGTPLIELARTVVR